MTRKTATARTAETFTSAVLDGAPAETALKMLGVSPAPRSEPSALRALVAEWKAANPADETEPAETVRKAEPSQDDRARAGKRSKRAPRTEHQDAVQRALEEGLTEEQAEAYARDAATGTAKLPAPKPAPAPKAPPVELDQAPVAAKAAKAAKKPAEPKSTPTERKAKPAKQTRTISPERARQIEAMEQHEATNPPTRPVKSASAPAPAVTAKATKAAAKARDPRLPPVGTVLTKTDRHGAVRCSCTVEADGFRYGGRLYPSISAAALDAARAIGIKNKTQNGFDFWGLNGEKKAPSKTAQVRDALSVLVLDAKIRAFLAKHDPKALAQAEAALA